MAEVIVRYTQTPENPDELDLSASFDTSENTEELHVDPEDFLAQLNARLESVTPLARGMSLERTETGFRFTLEEGEKVHVGFELPNDPTAFAKVVQNFPPSTEGYGLMRLNEVLYAETI